MLIRIFVVCLVAALTAACAAAPRERPVYRGPIEEGAGSLTAARKYLEGRWSLESFEVYPPGSAPLRLNGSGTLEYDSFSNLTMELRADQATADVMTKAGIVNDGGVVSTKGRVAVDMQNRTLTYVLEGQPAGFVVTGPLSTRRPRHWVVEGDLLTLTTQDDAGKPLSVGRWRKMP